MKARDSTFEGAGVDAAKITGHPSLVRALGRPKWLVVAALFAMCVGPTFISYQPYLFRWDDADYLCRSIEFSRAFWSWNVHGMGVAMVSIRPPLMTLMGLPWGPIHTWDGVGKCFITLTALISLVVALCLYLLLRVGVKPLLLLGGSGCAFASLGPFQWGGSTRYVATGFMADNLFAWTCLAAVLLIPYEAAKHSASALGSATRGILWATILSLGAMTKLSFLYFICIVPGILFAMRASRHGLRQASIALLTFICFSAPSALYLVRWGRPAFDNARASSFGRPAELYYHRALSPFLCGAFEDSPGLILSVAFLAIAVTTHLIGKRITLVWPRFLALVIMMGFGAIVLMAPNRQLRYSFPAIIAVPFLCAILVSGSEHVVTRRCAILESGLVLLTLIVVCLPVQYRASLETLRRCDAVLAHAAANGAKSIVLATDSPTLNQNLMDLALELSEPRVLAQVDYLAYHGANGVPLHADIRAISQSDQVVIQDKALLDPPFSNQRVPDYERYVRDDGYALTRLEGDVSVYSRQRGR